MLFLLSQSLKLCLSNNQMPMNELLNIIINNTSLTKLVLINVNRICLPVNLAEAQRFASEHPKLTEIELNGYQFMADNALALIRQLNSLKKFQFNMLQSEFRQLKSKLKNSEWQAKEEYIMVVRRECYSCVVLNRK